MGPGPGGGVGCGVGSGAGSGRVGSGLAGAGLAGSGVDGSGRPGSGAGGSTPGSSEAAPCGFPAALPAEPAAPDWRGRSPTLIQLTTGCSGASLSLLAAASPAASELPGVGVGWSALGLRPP
ncbi:hypothetical protein DMB66_34025 [Actinoplanes sp. ATCC 53533]|nr:hypothetical protein DMB66_34025 [Actinoplanes sp. ATCC 53533]